MKAASKSTSNRLSACRPSISPPDVQLGLAASSRAVVAIRFRGIDDPRFASVQFGQLPHRLLDAIHLAEAQLKGRMSDYQMRVLEISAIDLTVLWLKGDQQPDEFVVSTGGSDRNGGTLALAQRIDAPVEAPACFICPDH